MPRATPSKSRIENVIAAIKASGLSVSAVIVAADGGLTVSVDEKGEDKPPSPPRWGDVG